jgi:RHS repeat-associated protein
VVKNEFESGGDLMRIYGKANANAVERTYASGFSYTADGKIQRLRLGNGRWESAKFNERLQVTELALGTSDGDGSLWKLKYDYGELASNGTVDTTKNTGNIAKQTLSFNGLTNPLVQTYKYDSLYRLTEARETSNSNQTWKEAFNYDRYGNRLGHDKFVGTTQLVLDNKTHPTIDPSTNRFNPNQGYVYDKNGNLTDDAEGRTFIFNGENKQRYVVQSGKNVGEYFYDGEGKRVKKKVYELDGVSVKEETVFVYSAGKLVAEYSTKSPPPNPTTSYTATDQLGSPRVITDSNGQVISRRDFMPFGEEIVNNIGERAAASLKYNVADSVRQKFTGYQKDDETQLDFAEARMYENRHGRFTAFDPLLASGKSANPQSFNRFTYCLNNPLKYSDPNGLQAGTWVGRPSVKQPGTLDLTYTIAKQDGDVDVTYRNKAGKLVANAPNPDFVYLLNPKGPADGVQIAWSKLSGISKYDADGFDYTYSDDFLKRVNNDPNPGLVDVTLDTLMIAEGGFGLLRGAGKGAMELAVSRGGRTGLESLDALKSGITTERSALASEKGLNIVKDHLSKFGADEGNAGMIQRLENALANGERITGADRNFYMHELKENTVMNGLMKKGATFDDAYEVAHPGAIQWDKVSPFELYHPEIIQKCGTQCFGPGFFKYWGLPNK